MNTLLVVLLWTTYLISLYFLIFWFLVFLDKKSSFQTEEKAGRGLARHPVVSVIIPAYNEEKNIKATIQSVLNLEYPKDKLELIIIDDGSKDGTAEVVAGVINSNIGRNIKLIRQSNQGKAMALNNALAKIKGEFFACLDADSSVEQSTLIKMLYLYEQHDNKLTIVTPGMKLIKPKSFMQKLQEIEYIMAMFLCRLMSHLNCIYIAPGPFSLYRTETIRKLGGFDPKNLTEDQEIAYRVQLHQLRIKQCHNAFVYTLGPKTFRELYRQRNRWFKGSFLNFLKYRRMLFNKDYGDFGAIQMFTNISRFFLAASIVGFFFYFTFNSLFDNFSNMLLVGFDITPYLNTFTFNINPLGMDLAKISVLFAIFVLAFFYYCISHRNAKEKLFLKSGVFIALPYFLIYYIILSFISIIVMIEIIFGRKQKW